MGEAHERMKRVFIVFVAFHATFSRHAKAQTGLALVIWLNENVAFHATFSRQGND